ncbi:glycosyltransferase family 4 protein [Patescibacteria group bacterium]|nr:glycosyltransferase family 4 protein [Patescibacteria group bacterium]
MIPRDKIKIAVVTSGHIPSQWAHSINVMKTANAFFKLGYEVEVLTVERFLERRNRKKIKNVHNFYGVNEKIKILYFRRYFFDPEKRISQYCKKNNIDICYCRAYRVVYYNIKNGIPTILESHTTNVKHPDLKKVIKLSHSKYLKGLATVSDVVKQSFIKTGFPENKILVLQNGVDIEDFQNLPNKDECRKIFNLVKDKKIVVYCGSLFPDKGIEHILLVAKNIPDVDFLLAGGQDSQIKFWKDFTNSHKIENVQFVKFIERNKAPLFLQVADALIMPYKTDQKIERMDISTTSPLKLFEYMATKKPIISTNIPAISRIITHNIDGLLAEPNNIQELSRFVRMVLEDKQLAEKLTNNAYEKIKTYDRKKRCEKILSRFYL